MSMTMQMNTNKYPHMTKEDLAEMLGILPYWVGDYAMYGSDDNLVQYMQDRYGFGDFYQWKGDVLADGTYRADNDEDGDLDFIARIQIDDGMVYFYPYGVIAMPTDDGYFVTRMD